MKSTNSYHSCLEVLKIVIILLRDRWRLHICFLLALDKSIRKELEDMTMGSWKLESSGEVTSLLLTLLPNLICL